MPRARPGPRRDFDALVGKALAEVPERFRGFLENVTVLVEESSNDDETLYGVYEGVPLTERVSENAGEPAVVVIYRRPLLRDFGRDERELVRQIRITVLHEIGHHFGMDEDGLAFLDEE